MVQKTKNEYMSKLISNSKYGILKSEVTEWGIIPYTGPNWTCLYTGVKPNVHKITDEGWMLHHRKYQDITVNTIFDIIDNHYTQALMTLPLTYPAFKVNGWMISGYPSPKSLD